MGGPSEEGGPRGGERDAEGGRGEATELPAFMRPILTPASNRSHSSYLE